MMGHKKRKQDTGSEEDVDDSASDSDPQTKKATKTKQAKAKAPSKVKTVKKPKIDEPTDDESSPALERSKQPLVQVLSNAQGENYVDLGKKKRATVRSFKGQVYVDIREFYGTEGDEKPGKKGISLATDQWETLKGCVSTVDSLLAEQSSSKR